MSGGALSNPPAFHGGLHDVEDAVADIGRAGTEQFDGVKLLLGEWFVAGGLVMLGGGGKPEDVVGRAAKAFGQGGDTPCPQFNAPAFPRAVRRFAYTKVVGDFRLRKATRFAQSGKLRLAPLSFVLLTHLVPPVLAIGNTLLGFL